jgi:hypothetical protein
MDDEARPGATGPAGNHPAGHDPARHGEAGDDQAEDDQAAEDQAMAPGGASPPGTGDPRVDAALRLLDRLPELPVGEHAPVFERVHAELTAVLGDLDPDSAGTSGW